MNTVHVLYTCGCWERRRIDRARNTVCDRHNAYPQKVNTHEWRVRCPDCRYGRWTGQDRAAALRGQQEHVNRYPMHAPSVAYDRVTYDGGGSVLRFDGTRPRKAPAGSAERATIRVPQSPPF